MSEGRTVHAWKGTDQSDPQRDLAHILHIAPLLLHLIRPERLKEPLQQPLTLTPHERIQPLSETPHREPLMPPPLLMLADDDIRPEEPEHSVVLDRLAKVLRVAEHGPSALRVRDEAEQSGRGDERAKEDDRAPERAKDCEPKEGVVQDGTASKMRWEAD